MLKTDLLTCNQDLVRGGCCLDPLSICKHILTFFVDFPFPSV